MTTAGQHIAMLETLLEEIDALVRIVQGVTLHEYVASDQHGFQIPDSRKSESHIRSAEELFSRLLALDARPLFVARPVERRLIGVCRHFAVLLVAMFVDAEVRTCVPLKAGSEGTSGFGAKRMVREKPKSSLSANMRNAKRGRQLRRHPGLPIYGTATLTLSSKIFTPSPSRTKSVE
jgi:hypothetical protein